MTAKIPVPWTRDELDAALRVCEQKMAEIELECPDARPLPPLTLDECHEYFRAMLDTAAERPLTRDECFIHGQLLCVFMHAVRADVLGKKGRRYFVIAEDEVQNVIERAS